MTRVGLVACAAAKLDRPAPARDLYTSPLYRKARAYVEATCDLWFILSAAHGLVRPDTVLEPYDVTLARLPAADRRRWTDHVRQQLAAQLADRADREVVVLAGRHYRGWIDTLPDTCTWTVSVPMAGLGIGQQLAWLTPAAVVA